MRHDKSAILSSIRYIHTYISKYINICFHTGSYMCSCQYPELVRGKACFVPGEAGVYTHIHIHTHTCMHAYVLMPVSGAESWKSLFCTYIYTFIQGPICAHASIRGKACFVHIYILSYRVLYVLMPVSRAESWKSLFCAWWSWGIQK